MSHQLGRQPEELRTRLPVHASLVDEAQIHFVDQRRRLQSVIGALATKMIARQSPQFVIDKRHQFGGRILVAIAPTEKKRRDIMRLGVAQAAS
jgi:hypothetical protein